MGLGRGRLDAVGGLVDLVEVALGLGGAVAAVLFGVENLRQPCFSKMMVKVWKKSSYLPDTLGVTDLPAAGTGARVGGGLALEGRRERVGDREGGEGGEDDGGEVHFGWLGGFLGRLCGKGLLSCVGCGCRGRSCWMMLMMRMRRREG